MIGYINQNTTKILSVIYTNSGVHVALLPRSSSRINISAIINNNELHLVNEGLYINQLIYWYKSMY